MNSRILCFSIAGLLACCAESADTTVPGPEAENLNAGLAGSVVLTREGGDMVTVDLATKKEALVWKRIPQGGQPDSPDIHALSGPDSQGRIAYIENYFFVSNGQQQRHLLKTIKLDGSGEATLFTRPGDAIWNKKG